MSNPCGPATAGPNGADNVYKQASVTVDYAWEAVNN